MYRPQDTTVRELDRRTGDGIDVALLWNPRTSDVTVAVTDTRHGAAVEFGVKSGEALEAFWHPYAYLAHGERARLTETWSNRTNP